MNKKTLTKVATIFCLLLVYGCSDSSDKVEQYLESANKYFQQKDYTNARLEFKNALQLDDKLVDAYYKLVLIDEKEQNWSAVFAGLTKVIGLDPNHVDARLKLAQIEILRGEFSEALQQIDAVFKITKDNPKAYALKGAVFLKQQDLEGAMEMADKALSIDQSNFEAVSLKAVIFQQKNDFSSALIVLKNALLTHPNDISLYLLKLQIDLKRADLAAVEADYKELIQRFPEEMEFNYELAKFYSEHGEDDKSLQLLQSVVAKHPDDVKAKLLVTSLKISKDPTNAEETLKQAIAENENEPEFYFMLARFYINQKRFGDARLPLEQLITKNLEKKSVLAAKVLLAKLALQEDKIDDALAWVDEVLAADDGYFDALLLKARIHVINGEYDKAITELRGMLRDFSESDKVLVLLAQTYLKKNSPELAEENFYKAMELNPGNYEAVMPIVSRMMNSKDLIRAEKVLQKALEFNPDHAGALQALAQVRLLKKDWLGAQQVADLIAAKSKGKGFSHYLSGKIYQQQGLFQEAVDQYKSALSISPQLSDALKSLSVCYNALNQNNLMLDYLENYMKNNPDNPYPLLVKSEIFASEKKWDKALAVLNKAIDKWPNVEGFYLSMASIYEKKKDVGNVIKILKKGLTNIPNSINLRLFLAARYEMEKDYQNALDNYEMIVKERPDLDVAVNNLVSLMLDHFPTKENIAKAIKLAKRYNNSRNPYLLDTYGWALLKNGKTKQALSIFEKVVSMNSDVAVFKYHLGLAYSMEGNNEKAVSVLNEALETGAKQELFVEKDLTQQLLKKIKNGLSS